ncbi:LysR family transcriptional regulator [Pseudolabrys sp. Root1462]|uniref:LysR family transcriptional regulator n=1 Tax=Pseudolabrys sp. Root1462 TaxID=1736466 RepID=UPI0007030632|nr:LysR family transcriptional regulator [Pseudolabrys sp. Root1462]KQZ00313.1 LysR family transcriptional regulator [Pseudolabrys sp. Root1462]
MNFAAFDLNLLRVFDALARERSVTRAGDLIGLSQPAMSSALNRLRHILGDELFVRRGNDMMPTPRAEALASGIREALAQIEQTVAGDARFDPSNADRVFTLFGADLFSMQLMPRFAERIAALAPGIKLRLLDSASGDVERLLRDNVIDMALERPLDMPDWVSKELMFHSPFVVIAARGHADIRAARVKAGGKIPLALFCRLPHALRSIDGGMSGAVDDALRKHGAARQVVLTLPHFHAIGLAVARGRLIATVPVQFAKAVAAELGLSIYRPPIAVDVPDINLYWHRRYDQNPAHRWMRDQVMTAIKPFRKDSA